jgi:hypothetical protein
MRTLGLFFLNDTNSQPASKHAEISYWQTCSKEAWIGAGETTGFPKWENEKTFALKGEKWKRRN